LFLEAALMPEESLHQDYGRLAGFLRRIRFRLKLLATLQFLLLLSSGLILVLLGSFSALELKKLFPYLPFFYSILSIFFLCGVLFLGLWRMASKHSLEGVARELEKKFSHLKDDVTNSLLLFDQIRRTSGPDQMSRPLVAAQLRKTADEVATIELAHAVDLKRALIPLRVFIPLLFAFLAMLGLDPQFSRRSLALILHPFSALPVRATFISIEPKGSIVLRGTPVVIRAKTMGNVPERLMLSIWPEGPKEAIHLKMEPEGEGVFTYPMGSVLSSFSYQAYHGSAASPVYDIRVVDPPEVAKLKLILIPPYYTGLPREMSSEGHIEALKGTLVNLEAQATKVVTEGRMVLNQGSQFVLKVEGDRLKGSLPIFHPGTYSIRVKDELGFENLSPAQYEIRIIPDRDPEGKIISPGQDLEVSGNEVIPVLYTAKDDFGITSVRLNYQMAGKERFIDLKGHSGRSLGVETFKWDLSNLDLTPGERVLYRLEIWDNDSVSGPKAGYSRTFAFSVKDDKARAARESEEAQQIADALLDLLADQLEDKRDRDSLAKGLEDIEKQIDKSLGRMREKTERFDWDALKSNLVSLKERMGYEAKETVTQEMERLALHAEDMAKRARMEEVEALAKEVRNRQRRLVDSFNDLKDRLTGEGLEAMMKELKRIEELLRSVMDALSKLATGLPDEFMNSQEVRALDFQDLFKDLEEIQKRLMAGDLSGALEAAQRLLQALSEMMAALGRAGAQAGMSPFDRLQGEMSRQSGELEKIVGEQREILKETEKVNRDVRARVEDETEKRLNHSLPQLREVLEELRRFFPDEQRQLIEELGKRLGERSLEQFSKLVEDLAKDLSEKPAQELIRELKKRMEDLTPSPNEIMTQDDRAKFPDLTLRQENLKERTSNLKEKLDMLAQLFPGMDTEILNDLKGAAGSMGEASGRLGREDAPGAIPPEQETIRRLTRSQQAMQQMAQQMAMRMAARWGYELVYDPRAGWYYGPWVPRPTLPQPEFKRPLEKGYTGIDREEFDPPSKDAYKVPKMFREKILESLKEGVPSQYKRDVERYFRGLAE
jgi:hypothetical protein